MKEKFFNVYNIFIGLIFLLGFLLRIKAYSLGRPLWHDECSLAVSIITKNPIEMLFGLNFSQKAPFLFMLTTQLTTNIFKMNEFSLRLIPLISGLLSIFAFYLLSLKFLKNKSSIILANLLFAINYQLIYYSQEFKQYSSDVFLFIITILLLNKMELENINWKKSLLFSILSFCTVLYSFPCAFALGGYLIYCILNNKNIKFKKVLIFEAPILIAGFLYYYIFLNQIHTKELNTFSNYWTSGFIKLDILNIILIFKENLNYFFTPNILILFGILLFFIGLINLIKNLNIKINSIILWSIFCVILASFFHFYPIFQRVALYIVPLLILIMTKSLDAISKNHKIYSALIIFLFIAYFCKYTPSFYKAFLNNPKKMMPEDAKITMELMMQNLKPSDIVFVNNASNSDFAYYSSFYTIKNQIIREKLSPIDNTNYINMLNLIPKGNYWFYLPFDYSHDQKVPHIIEWARTKKNYSIKQIGSSYLIHLQQ